MLNILSGGVSGIIFVENKLAVVPTKNITDKEIAKDIMDAMERNANISPSDVDVKVVNGRATLTGEVSDYNAYKAAYDSALYTSGVVKVIDKITIAITD